MCVCVCVRARVRAVVSDPWMVAYQAPQSMECSRQEYWSGLPFPTPGDLPNLGGSNLHLLCLLHGQADFFFFNQCITWKGKQPPGWPPMVQLSWFTPLCSPLSHSRVSLCDQEQIERSGHKRQWLPSWRLADYLLWGKLNST